MIECSRFYKRVVAVALVIALGAVPLFSNASAAQQSAGDAARERAGRNSGSVRDHRGVPAGTPHLTSSQRAKLLECVNHMLIGPGKKKIKVRGYKFNCKAHSSWVKTGDLYKISGRLSHRLKYRPDDQIDYSFLVSASGEVGGLEIDSNSGGFRKISGKLVDAANSTLNPVEWFADKAMKDFGSTIDGSWKGSAALIIGTMAIRTGQSIRNASSRASAGSQMLWLVDRPGGEYRNVLLPQDKQQPEFCQNICGQDRQCRAWTFKKETAKHGPTTCSLKNSIPAGQISDLAVSGVNRSRRIRRPRR